MTSKDYWSQVASVKDQLQADRFKRWTAFANGDRKALRGQTAQRGLYTVSIINPKARTLPGRIRLLPVRETAQGIVSETLRLATELEISEHLRSIRLGNRYSEG